MKFKSKDSIAIAEALISHFGFSELAKICKTTQPAISQWKTNGIPYSWESYFRAQYPTLPIWKEVTEGDQVNV